MKRIWISLVVVMLHSFNAYVAADDFVSNMMSEQYGSNAVGKYPERLIIYIGTNAYPLTNANAITDAGIELGAYNLDAHHNLEEHLSYGLEVSPKMSASEMDELQLIVEQRFSSLSEEELQGVFKPVMLTERWDIRKVPAFVFGNGDAVIYGTTDANVALVYWNTWASTHVTQQ